MVHSERRARGVPGPGLSAARGVPAAPLGERSVHRGFPARNVHLGISRKRQGKVSGVCNRLPVPGRAQQGRGSSGNAAAGGSSATGVTKVSRPEQHRG